MNQLQAIAEQRHTDPLNTWPPHNDDDERIRTDCGVRILKNGFCLRCYIEDAAARAARKAKRLAKLARQEELACLRTPNGRKEPHART